ncbi:MAG: TonB-dependent receptor [Acidobacteriia bacterium]|nr:TonB-dependent receptor [Terriglobia bacterium]
MRRNEFHLRTRFGLVLILVTALLAGMAQLGMAQEVTGAITGKITDPSAGAIVNATITAKDMDRGTVWKAQTNEEGLYSLPRLPIGRCEIRAEAGGVIQVSDTAIFTRGLHTLRMGFQMQRYRNNYIPATSNDGAAGQIGFSGQYTGSAETDFLPGLPSYMSYGQGFAGTVGQRNNAIGAFFQDDWRINSRLTINLGLRWQGFTPIYEVHDRMTNFGEYTGQIQLAGQNGNSRALYNQYNGIANFLPRLGLAWTPWGDRTVIRAAFSRSSFWEGTGEYNRLATNAPWNVDLVGTFGAGTNGSIPANQVTLDQGFGALGADAGGVPCTVTTVTSVPASCFAGVRIHATDPNYRPAVSNQWNLTLQRQLTNSLTLQAAYVGQHTDHMAAIYNMGQNVLFPDGTSMPGPYLSGNSTLKNIGTGQQRLNTSTGIQNYNALQQLTAQQRPQRGPDVPAQLHLAEVPDQQSGLLRPVRRCPGKPGQRGRLLPGVCLQHQAGLRALRSRRDQRPHRLPELGSALRP